MPSGACANDVWARSQARWRPSRQGERSLVVRADEILWIEAEDYCGMIHSTRGRHLVRASLASLESRLDPSAFVRVHRTAIVNVQHMRETRDRDGMCLTLTDGTQRSSSVSTSG